MYTVTESWTFDTFWKLTPGRNGNLVVVLWADKTKNFENDDVTVFHTVPVRIRMFHCFLSFCKTCGLSQLYSGPLSGKTFKLFIEHDLISGAKWIQIHSQFFITRGTQREIFRKRPKNNNKAWIKLSEAILKILGGCLEKFICSSLLARLLEEFQASKVQPDLLGSFLPDVYPDITDQFGCDHKTEFSPLLSEGGVGGGGKGRGFWEMAHSSHSRHQNPSDTLNCLFPSNTSLPRTYYFSKSSS